MCQDSKLENLEKDYNARKNITFSFYKTNHLYYSYCEYRHQEELNFAGGKIEHKINDLFEFKRGKIVVNLNEEYFKLYTCNPRQVQKLKDIQDYIALAKKLNISFELVKDSLKNWVKDLSITLDSFNINHHHLLLTIK